MKKINENHEILKLDFDFKNRDLLKKILKKRLSVLRILGIDVLSCFVFETCKGYHVYLKINGNFSYIEIIALQALLGSDYKREAFNLKRFRSGLGKEWNILFEKKFDENGKKIYEEKELKDLSNEIFLLFKKKCENNEI
ncbi:MAG: hypothetical protein ABIM64_01680 [candidate division WOR-3 bacterium]